MKIEIEVPDCEIPAGYEVIGFRPPTAGEFFIYDDGGLGTAQFDFTSSKIILKKVKRLRRFTIAEIDWTETYLGYFTNFDGSITTRTVEGSPERLLWGVRPGVKHCFLDSSGSAYKHFWVVEE